MYMYIWIRVYHAMSATHENLYIHTYLYLSIYVLYLHLHVSYYKCIYILTFFFNIFFLALSPKVTPLASRTMVQGSWSAACGSGSSTSNFRGRPRPVHQWSHLLGWIIPSFVSGISMVNPPIARVIAYLRFLGWSTKYRLNLVETQPEHLRLLRGVFMNRKLRLLVKGQNFRPILVDTHHFFPWT